MRISDFLLKCLSLNSLSNFILGFLIYLEQLPEFCSRDSSLIVKEIFGVTEYGSSSFEFVFFGGVF